MRRAALLALLAAWVPLAGCPLPQPLPEYSSSTNTPPRILVDDQLAPRNSDFDGAVTFVPASCATVAPSYTLSTRIVDTNTVESVEARWFVNYDFRDAPWNEIQNPNSQPIVIGPNPDTTNLVRVLPTFPFSPYSKPPPYGTTPPLSGPPWPQAGVVRVVELVVSNGFDPGVVGTTPGGNRSPRPGFETQVYRWVFLTVPESASVPCPQ